EDRLQGWIGRTKLDGKGVRWTPVGFDEEAPTDVAVTDPGPRASRPPLFLSAPAAGSLDHSFNRTGRLVVKTARYQPGGNPFETTRLEPPVTLSAPGPKGELVVANRQSVLRYRADGLRQRHFGGDGRVAIPTPAGMSFQLAGVAADSRGRVVVAGTTRPVGATDGSRSARVSVYRFKSDGKLDRSFGAGGVAGDALGPMEASGLAVDSRDRPVLTGLSALTPSSCNTTPVYLNTTVVARLTSGGAPDPTFGAGGTYTDPLEDPHLPTLTTSGKVIYASAPERRCAGFDGHISASPAPVASILAPSGSLALRVPARPGGPNLPWLAGLLEVTSLAVDRKNRIVMLETAYPPEGGDELLQVVRRFLPNGSPDPEFGGRYWEAGTEGAPNPPGGVFDAVATDARNRIILGGSAMRREGSFVARRFLAVRVNAAGQTQSGFGEGGVVTVRIGKKAEATATQVYLDSRGRIVLGGTLAAPWLSGRPGFALVRLLSGGR
ncbi:MAG TPA: hypothetical protein VFS26_00745, partial [Solirubrobacterales bacterium]|nr:hypothetical protein [Solirubrobacterales bacterium]